MVYSVSRTLYRYNRLEVKFSTKIVLEDSNLKETRLYQSIFEFDKKEYMLIETRASISVTYKAKDRPKLLTDSLYITDRNLYYFIALLKDMKEILYTKDDIFLTEKGHLEAINKDKYKKNLDGLGHNNKGYIYHIVDGEYPNEIESVAIVINEIDNLVILDIDSFNGLIFALEKVDFFVYSQLLLNYFISSYGKQEKLIKNTPKYRIGYNPFGMSIKDPVADIVIEDKIQVPKSNKSIFDTAGLN